MTKEEGIKKGKISAFDFLYKERLDLLTYSKLDHDQREISRVMLQTCIDALVRHKKLLEKAEESLF